MFSSAGLCVWELVLCMFLCDFFFFLLFVVVDCCGSTSLSLVCSGSALFFCSCASFSSLLCVSFGFYFFCFYHVAELRPCPACSNANFSYVSRSQTQSFPAISCLRIMCLLRRSFATDLLPIVLLLALPFLFLLSVLTLRLCNLVKLICVCAQAVRVSAAAL